MARATPVFTQPNFQQTRKYTDTHTHTHTHMGINCHLTSLILGDHSPRPPWVQVVVGPRGKRHGFCTKNDGFCTTNDGLCTKHDWLFELTRSDSPLSNTQHRRTRVPCSLQKTHAFVESIRKNEQKIRSKQSRISQTPQNQARIRPKSSQNQAKIKPESTCLTIKGRKTTIKLRASGHEHSTP